jgi:hypothetical protein
MTKVSLLRVVLVCAVLSASLGCKSLFKKREPVGAASDSAPVAVVPPPPAPVASLAPSAAASGVAEALVTSDDLIPASEDFEDEAFQKVTSATLKTEILRLQKEIATK